MTTTSQCSLLTSDELLCLSECSQGRSVAADAGLLEALAAKGMLDRRDDGYVLTPAAQHVLHVGEPGMVPGIDN